MTTGCQGTNASYGMRDTEKNDNWPEYDLQASKATVVWETLKNW